MERAFDERATIEHRPHNGMARVTEEAEPWWRSKLVVTVLGVLAAAVAPSTVAIHGGLSKMRELELAAQQRDKELGLATVQKTRELELAREQKDKDLALVQEQHAHKVLIDLLDRVIDPDIDPEVRQPLLRFLAQYPGGPFQEWARSELALVNPAVDKIVRIRSEAHDKEASVRKMSDELKATRDELVALKKSHDPRAKAKARQVRTALKGLVGEQKSARTEAQRLRAQLKAAKNPSGVVRVRPPRALKRMLKSAVRQTLSVRP